MNDFLTLVILLALLPYFLVPIFIWRNQFFPLQPQMRLVLNNFLPKSVSEIFEKKTRELEPLGFEFRIDAVSLDYGPNLRVFLRMFVAKNRNIVAVCTSFFPDGAKKPVNDFLELVTRFKNGKEVCTHNSDFVGAPIESSNKISTSLVDVQNPKLLVSLHEQFVKTSKLKKSQAVLPKIGEEFASLVNSFKIDLKKQTELGGLRIDHDARVYRPTFAGACLMAWYSMWPISFFRRIISKIKTRPVIRKAQKANA